MAIDSIAATVRDARRVSAEDALELYHDAPLPLLGELADGIRSRKHPAGVVTYIIDRNVNYTNICVARCASVIPTSGCMRSRRRKSSTFLVCRVCQCPRSSTV